MTMRSATVAALVAALMGTACSGPTPKDRGDANVVVWKVGPPLPAPVTNNAVAAVKTDQGVVVLSALGMDSTKSPGGVTNVAYRWDQGAGAESWRVAPPVPGPGRLGATAQSVGGRIYVMGGYTVRADGKEHTVGSVDIYDPSTDSWRSGAPMPVSADDAVSGVWRDSLIVVISGWHEDHNIRNVQVYDPAHDRWIRGDDIEGTPVFGAAGGVVGNQLVYIDGARTTGSDPKYALNEEGWVGALDTARVGSIAWSKPSVHPAPALYRAASGSLGNLVLFAGGSDNPYNYDGIGYDGKPSEPVRQVLAYAPGVGRWRNLAAPPIASMDHRTLGIAGGMVFLVGGMEAGQRVSSKVWYVEADKLLAPLW